MVKRKILTAVFSLLALITFVLVMLAFLKIDISCPASIAIYQTNSIMAISYKDYCYINNSNINKVTINHKQEKYYCKIEYNEKNDDFYFYYINLPSSIYKNHNQLNCVVILDTINIYQYIFN